MLPTHDISKFGAGKDKVVIAVLDESEVLGENAFNVSASLRNVPSYPASQHEIRVGVLIREGVCIQ
jgi:hypothetical protein